MPPTVPPDLGRDQSLRISHITVDEIAAEWCHFATRAVTWLTLRAAVRHDHAWPCRALSPALANPGASRTPQPPRRLGASPREPRHGDSDYLSLGFLPRFLRRKYEQGNQAAGMQKIKTNDQGKSERKENTNFAAARRTLIAPTIADINSKTCFAYSSLPSLGNLAPSDPCVLWSIVRL